MQVNMKKIAAACGVSQPTVSNILGGKDQGYNRATVERVRARASTLGYRTNAAARAMRNGRFNNVTLLLGSHPAFSVLPPGLLDGLEDALHEHGLHLSVAKLTDKALLSGDAVPGCLREFNSDGVLIYYTGRFPDEVSQAIRRHQSPCIWMNLKQPSDCVYPDDHLAGMEVTRYLLGLGHIRIAYLFTVSSLTSPNCHYSAIDRCAAYCHAMRSAGLTPRVFDQRNKVQLSKNHLAIAKACVREAELTAIVAYGDVEAQTAIYAAAALGRQVPEDMSVITFSACGRRMDNVPLLTTMNLPEYEIGQAAVEMLVRKIAKPTKKLDALALPCTLIPGHTCAPPRVGKRTVC